MYGFLAGLSSPESIFAEKILISCFVTKQEICYFFPKTGNMLFFPKNRKYFIFSQNRIISKIALFHINHYFIGKVNPIYGFLAGFSSPKSIFAEKILISCFVTKTGNMLFFPKIALFHINCYFIGKVSPIYGFLAGFSSPKSIFAEKNYLSPVL